MVAESENREVYLKLISLIIRKNIGLSETDGSGFVINRVFDTVNQILNYATDDPDLAGLSPFMRLYSSLFSALRRIELFTVYVSQIVDDLTLDDGTKKGLKLVLRALDLEKVTDKGVNLISVNKLVEEVPIINELGADVRLDLVNKLRIAYSNLLFEKRSKELDNFLSNLADCFEKYDLASAYELLQKEIIKLHFLNIGYSFLGGMVKK